MHFIPVKELFSYQFQKGVFFRMDIVVKYMAIENFFDLNDFGFNFYTKYIKKRKEYWERLGKRKKNKFSSERFKNLIQRIKKGYNCDFPIEIYKNSMQIRNGSHRFACAIFFNVNNISVVKSLPGSLIDLSTKWFEETNFGKSEIGLINEKFDTICKKMN